VQVPSGEVDIPQLAQALTAFLRQQQQHADAVAASAAAAAAAGLPPPPFPLPYAGALLRCVDAVLHPRLVSSGPSVAVALGFLLTKSKVGKVMKVLPLLCARSKFLSRSPLGFFVHSIRLTD
jgi:hypothetical protein